MMKRTIFISQILFLCMLNMTVKSNLYSQDQKIFKQVQAKGICSLSNLTYEQALNRALDNARAEAIKSAVGLTISENLFSLKTESVSENKNRLNELFSKMIMSSSNGRIVNENIVSKEIIPDKQSPYVEVNIEADVVKEEGEKDQQFQVNLNLYKDVFFVNSNGKGESLEVNIKSTKDCYVYLFNIMANDSVQLLIPNNFSKDNYYQVTRSIQPFEEIIKSFEVGLYSKKQNVSIEGLLLIGLKEKIDFLSNSASGMLNKGTTLKAAFLDIQKWLIRIPLNKRAEAFSSFEIRRTL